MNRTLEQKNQLERINRIITRADMKVVTARGSFHLLDTFENIVIDRCVDLDELEAMAEEQTKLATIDVIIEDLDAMMDAERHRQLAAKQASR